MPSHGPSVPVGKILSAVKPLIVPKEILIKMEAVVWMMKMPSIQMPATIPFVQIQPLVVV
ncbi:hypothetical protein A2191_03100 [Candidatus Woesebacteria bacterium RIFOXYA1_FULL_38_9]|nr:MAG: hypothetical protein A2191_03100 [Candidatus Woesebacteria bacterium RIFOXYA1_FULL_38_9]